MVVKRYSVAGLDRALVVGRAYRRQGVATQLLAAAERWARENGLVSVTAAMQSRDDAAVRLFQGRRYGFRGAIDHYYHNGDIALLFALDL
jgi:GNAT superfamily N-acetyltransferase